MDPNRRGHALGLYPRDDRAEGTKRRRSAHRSDTPGNRARAGVYSGRRTEHGVTPVDKPSRSVLASGLGAEETVMAEEARGNGQSEMPAGNSRRAAAADRQRAIHKRSVVRKSARAAKLGPANNATLRRHQRRCQSAKSEARGFRSRPDDQRDSPHSGGTGLSRRTRLRDSGDGQERAARNAGRP